MEKIATIIAENDDFVYLLNSVLWENRVKATAKTELMESQYGMNW